MSGNTLILGIRIGLGDFALALYSVTAVLGYIAGVALAGEHWKPKFALTRNLATRDYAKIITVEFLLLVVFMIVGFIAGKYNL